MIFALLQAMPGLEDAGVNAINALIPIAVPFIVWGVRKVLPKIPRVALPVVALGLGVGLDAFLAMVTGGTWTPIVGALLGGLGVVFREIVDTAKEHGKAA